MQSDSKCSPDMENYRFGPDSVSVPEVQIQLAMIKLPALSMHKTGHVLTGVSRDRSAKLRRVGSIPSARQMCRCIFVVAKSYTDRCTFRF